MTISPFTPDELIAILNKTSLPTVLVEGSTDFSIYRWVEGKLDISNIDILPCSGRGALLEVYERRGEITNNIRVAFVADRDMWLYTSIPDIYQDVIWTDGYSIENDLYEPSNIESLLTEQEHAEMQIVLREIIKWFAFEVEQFRSHGEAHVGTHPKEVVQPNTTVMCSEFSLRRRYREPDISTIEEVANNHKLNIRGKNLFQLLLRFLSSSNRSAKYSNAALVEIALKTTQVNPRLERIMREVERLLSAA